MVVKRHEAGKSYGVILIPEGLIEQVYDMKALIEGALTFSLIHFRLGGLGLTLACVLDGASIV